MFLRNLTRANAARYSMYAVAPMVLGVGAAAWVAQSEPENYAARVSDTIKPYAPPVAPEGVSKPAAESNPDASEMNGSAIAARFDAIKNRPVPVEVAVIPHDEIPPPPPPATGDIKYIGPVRLGPVMLAILNVEGKQQSVGKGKTITYTLESQAHAAKVVEITDTQVTLDEEGTQRVIVRADSGGEVVSYLGGKPTRGKAFTLKKKAGKGKGGEHPLDSNAAAEFENKRAAALERFAPLLERIAKEKNPAVAAQLRDKILSSIKAEGLDPSAIDDELSKMKETGGDH